MNAFAKRVEGEGDRSFADLFYVAFVFGGSYIWSIMYQGCTRTWHLYGHMGTISAELYTIESGGILVGLPGGISPDWFDSASPQGAINSGMSPIIRIMREDQDG